MTQNNQQPEPDKNDRIEKHYKKVEGKKHSASEEHMSHAHLKQNDRNHNYTYMKHLDEYKDDNENES